MADGVFDVCPQFAEGLVIAVGTEDRVIAEAPYPTPLTHNLTIDDTFEQMFLGDAATAARTDVLLLDQGDDGAETGLAVVFVREFAEQTGHIGFAVVALGGRAYGTYGAYGIRGSHAGIAGTVNAGSTAKGFYLEAGIVGEAVYMVVVIDIMCLLQGVFLQRLSRLWNILMAPDVGERQHLYPIAQNLPDLLQFVRVISCKNNFHLFHSGSKIFTLHF